MKSHLRIDAAFLALLPLLVALPAIGEPAEVPSALVRTFFTRYAAGDLRGAAELWVPGAPAEDFTRKHQRRIERRCIRIDALKIDETSTDPGIVTTVETLALRSGKSPASPEWTETSHSRFVLQRDGDRWRIAKWESRERELVERLAQAADTAERARIMASAGDLATTSFVRLLAQRSIDFVNQQRFDAADDLSDAALRVAERLGDAASIAVSLSARGVIARSRSIRDFDTALEVGRESLLMAEASGDPDVLGRALIRLARTAMMAEGVPDAQALERALAIAEDLEFPGTAAIAATDLAVFHEARGQLRETFRLAELASRYAEESGNAAAKISAAMLLAGEYRWIRNFELAARYSRRVIELATEAGFDLSVATGMMGLADVAFESGRGDDALAILEEGLQKVQSDHARAALLRRRADTEYFLGRLDEAERDLDLSLEKVQKDESAAQNIELFRALIEFKRGNLRASLAHAEQARGPNGDDDRRSRRLKAKILLCLGQVSEARLLLEEVVLEEDVTPLAHPGQSLFAASRARNISRNWLHKLLVEQGELLMAIGVAEQMKASELRDALAEGRIDSSESMAPQEQERERAIEIRMRELNRALMAERSPSQAEALRKRLFEARGDLEDFRQRAYALTPGMRTQRPREIRLDDLPPELDDVTIISYVDGAVDLESPAGDDLQTTVFVIEPKRDGRRRLTARVIPTGGRDLARRIERFATLIAQRNLRVPDLAEEMYDLLLGPIEPAILSARSLCIIPDSSLWRVPFHALGRRGQPPLVDRMPVFYAPSIAVLAAATSKRDEPGGSGTPTLLAFANPNAGEETASLYRALNRNATVGSIPETESEVRAIASLYGKKRSRTFVGVDARESVFKDRASQYDVLHIAAHGIVYDSAPMFSSLLLTASAEDRTEDGVLEAREIAALHLNADVAVLSACETGKADNVRGGGVIGLSWAFLAAGCPTTVVSQWKAQSAATAQLMVEFHRQLTRGASKPEALRRAQLALRRDPRYRHPFYWAPFVVIGAP